MGITFTNRATDTIGQGELVRVEIRPGVYRRMSASEARQRGLKIKQEPDTKAEKKAPNKARPPVANKSAPASEEE